MTKTNKITRFSAKSLLLSIGLTLAACGGGGGGGTSYPNISYTGAENMAIVDETNAADFPIAMLEGSTSSANSNPIGATIDGNAQSAQHTAMLNILAKQFKNDIASQLKNPDKNQVSAVTETFPGDCSPNPGSLTFTDNSSAGNLNGSFTYNNFCVGDLALDGFEITLHGKMIFSGIYILDGFNNPIFQSMTITIPYFKLTVLTNTDTFTEEFSGSMTMTFDGTIDNNIQSLSVTTNFQANGLTYKIENLQVVDTLGELNISGRFYHPTHGYVDVTTTEPFDLYISAGNPDKYCSGTMELAGDGGVIEFTANTDCTQYQVTFTATGNFSGIPDYDSGLVDWP